MIYLLVALLITMPILVGVIDLIVHRKIVSKLINSHQEEIRQTKSEWYQSGWDAAIDWVKQEAYYEMIKKGQIVIHE